LNDASPAESRVLFENLEIQTSLELDCSKSIKI